MVHTLISLLLLMFTSAAGYASELAICYEGDTGYSVKAPKNWVLDNKTADEHGLCTVYIPQGTTFRFAPSIIFPRILKTQKEGQEAIQEVIKDFTETLRKASQSSQVKIKPDFTTKKKLTFTVREYLYGPADNDFERIGYIANKNVVYFVVLSSRTLKDLEAAEAKFFETLENIEPVEPESLKKLKKAKEHKLR